MHDLVLLVILLIALACGWWLGKKQGRIYPYQGERLLNGYFDGLDSLLKVQTSEAIEKLVDVSQRQENLVEINLALGRLFRAKGELDKATQTHQMLLARTDLEKDKLQLVQYELAVDYVAAGLLDRAERLLEELAQEQGNMRSKSLELLMQVYQREREWDKAITAAQALMSRKAPQIKPVLAHYHCELALLASNEEDYRHARRLLKKALHYDPDSVRASLLKARIDAKTDHLRDAVKAYRKIREQDADFMAEVLPELMECYQKLGKEKEFVDYLLESLREENREALHVAAAKLLKQSDASIQEMLSLTQKRLQQEPSLRGLSNLLEMRLQSARRGESAGMTEALEEIQKVIDRLLLPKPLYRCSECGFAGKKLVWLCPSCQQWGTIRPINGAEDD